MVLLKKNFETEVPRLSVRIDSFTYPDRTVALADITLNIHRGEFVGVLGSNGSGKTTLLKIMDGSAEGFFREGFSGRAGIKKIIPQGNLPQDGPGFPEPGRSALCVHGL